MANISESICIECGKKNFQELYRKYTGGSIQLSQCFACKNFLDKYIEYDAVILMLDIFLLRIQSYRHMIFNYKISQSVLWRVIVLLVLCEGYIKLRLLQPETKDFVLLQFHFHLSLLHSIIEFLLLLIISYILLVMFSEDTNIVSWNQMLRVIVISSFVKFFAVVAMIWVDEFYIHFLLFLSLPAQLQAYKAIFPNSYLQLVALVSSKALLFSAINIALTALRMTVYDTFKGQIN